MPIYTKTGDSGTTSLFGGKRVLKSEELVDAYGTVDELNSWVGLISSELKEQHQKKLFWEIQSDLLTIGGTLAGGTLDLTPLETRVPQMEVEIDAIERIVKPLNNFILPGGSIQASRVHIARSVCRRAERKIVALSRTKHVDPSIIKYLNRLSDLFFMLARFINKNNNVSETAWSGIPRQKPR